MKWRILSCHLEEGEREYLLSSKRQTCPYPEARQKVSEKYRGMIELDREKCTSCTMCARVCPPSAIKMREEDGKEMPSLDYARCIFCGFCVEVCPTNALEHKNLHDLVFRDFEEHKFAPKKLSEAGKDPYTLPEGEVKIKIDEEEGLLYE
ncbi:hypothetical protein AKJ57_02850 [candidate division MSBL1 archaeon SCGC-AAA259A05]|uniref:4Fe-4S ferredoxin-type domain-containing protein n=1 Tax=candidate division MSBL1 archaeon SCGC-AAA259A05 TaxID=1698259 RepID=A0A133U9W3_9EURY|nr:hypothetical protein AKJ57_02850 [candidate division MSBL1 archaeon SCGC-AAA259A05]